MTKYLIVFFMATTSIASAQQLSISEKMELRADCGQDFKRLCPGIQPGDGALKACIKSKEDQLSKTCAGTISKLMTKKDD